MGMGMGMRVRRLAVVYATGQGTTKEVAEVIAKGLESSDTVVEVVAIGHRVPDLRGFDTVVLGSPVYHEALLKSFVVFACQRLEQLEKPDVWLFSIGMAPALTGPVGRRVARAVPKEIAIVRDALAVRGYRAFAGRFERAGLPMRARLRYFLLGGRRYGDLRDWNAISSWAAEIAADSARRDVNV
ncbi:flavodoxin [Nocardia tengchongensis]|uniref:Flavodoxin n=1 Tax=Nocardia tengchongensis TaxID=2055889 RepID=A0ABX8CN32_9NOCA|nr:flavodoxin domain-containing protein [Nocardia tengchongensis]QVI19920.1 flavodoxin [Nocardia tengchongensis]